MKQTNRTRAVEMLIFFGASGLGVYSLGRALTGLFEPGKGIDTLWLAVLAGTVWILFAQMGRVKDTWPRRGSEANARATTEPEKSR
jgi:hypothetical protein